jgi:hypothetical protein
MFKPPPTDRKSLRRKVRNETWLGLAFAVFAGFTLLARPFGDGFGYVIGWLAVGVAVLSFTLVGIYLWLISLQRKGSNGSGERTYP